MSEVRVADVRGIDVQVADVTITALARRLCGSRALPERPVAGLLQCARRNRVHLLLAGRLDPDHHTDQALRAELREEYRDAAVRDAWEAVAVRELVTMAETHGARPLLFKGVALAHRAYERSWERPRGDIDLFIAEDAVPAMCRALEVCGWQRVPAVTGPLVTRQFQYHRPAVGPMELHVDVHTCLFNPAAFAGALEWKDADARAVAVPALGPMARTLSDADALLVACLHRVAHHDGEADLIWLYDIDRLARRLGVDDWTAFAARATRAQVRHVCHAGLERAATLFDTPAPPTVLASLVTTDAEPSAAFLQRGAGELHVQWLNLRHLRGWRARAALLRQHIFPSRDYMQARYGEERRWILPLCYAHRVVVGVPRWFQQALKPEAHIS